MRSEIFFSRFKCTALLFLAIAAFSCNNTPTPPAADTLATSSTGKSEIGNQPIDNPTYTRTTIGSSGFTINLPSSHQIETHQGAGFTMVYYITPFDTLLHPGEAGMYFGPTPDVKPPSIDYQQEVLDTVFLGKPQKWVEYTTAKYVQRETFIDEGNGQYIHVWCYSNDAKELDRLFRMMLSMQR
jgi:hypothetical protein